MLCFCAAMCDIYFGAFTKINWNCGSYYWLINFWYKLSIQSFVEGCVSMYGFMAVLYQKNGFIVQPVKYCFQFISTHMLHIFYCQEHQLLYKLQFQIHGLVITSNTLQWHIITVIHSYFFFQIVLHIVIILTLPHNHVHFSCGMLL